ncbi:MAG: EamA family transporter [Candidatus Marsarchaeota archaeon]|jgi:drug/metabolite transporter (DMT)-like permease|nr:EamA family transporter [Candidatus Marsarchaeota archaeon]MCL5112325.1 EamA family transporter [Candidatus Marsarchaeota archaeon]
MHIYIVIFITLVAAGLASIAQIFFKQGLKSELKTLREVVAVVKERNIVIGIIVYFSSLAIYLYALKSAPLSIVYPTFGSVFIFTALLSMWLLGERIGKRRVAGIVLVFLGVALVSITI